MADLRGRDFEGSVRLEVAPGLVARVAARPAIAEVPTDAGFTEPPRSVEPFRSGRLNAGI